MVTHSIESLFKRAPAPRRRLDLNALAQAMATVLNACAADWRAEILGDMVAQLRRRNPALSEPDISALLAAIKARIERGAFGRKVVLE